VQIGLVQGQSITSWSDRFCHHAGAWFVHFVGAWMPGSSRKQVVVADLLLPGLNEVCSPLFL
jgi:hypothetical protein